MNSSPVEIFKALSDETRIAIVKFLIKHKELSCQEISRKFSLSQPALSHHFNKLMDAGILKVRKDGVAHIYSVDLAFLNNMGLHLEKI